MTFSQALSGLDSWKAHGPDEVPPFVFKNCASELAPWLVKLFHLYLPTAISLTCWKFTHIKPVPKKDDRSNPSNYHQIRFISAFLKSLSVSLIRSS